MQYELLNKRLTAMENRMIEFTTIREQLDEFISHLERIKKGLTGKNYFVF